MNVRRAWRIVRLALLATSVPGVCWSQTTVHDLSALSIEQLLEIEVTSTASRFPQEVTHAPASVTVVTAAEIHDRGYRSLADILDDVRGFYTTDDRNYRYIGVRGFARPGDYNTRVLVLVDGHRLNEPIYDMAPIGADLPFDVDLIERVEVSRGPGSSLYGTSAFLAVINVITKTGATYGGVRVKALGGSLGTEAVTGSVGRAFDNGRALLVGVSGYNSAGNRRLYFPEFADVTGGGVARDADGERAASAFASASLGRYTVRAGFVDRAKHIPTASFGTVFGDRRTRTDDRWMFADVAYSGSMGKGWTGTARGAFDVSTYEGSYPYDVGEADALVQHDASASAVASGELTISRRWERHLFMVGTEFRRDLLNHQWVDERLERVLDERHNEHVAGFYLQDEVTLRPWLLLNAGARLDYHSSFGSHATPRVGLVFLPRRQSAVKLLYGRAYRAPNSYELYYYDALQQQARPLDPETIATTEFVWEEYVGSHLRSGLSVFHWDARELIEQRSLGDDLASDDALYFANAGRSIAYGVEGEIEGRWSRVSARVAYANTHAEDGSTGLVLSNSPRHLASTGVTVPLTRLSTRITIGGRVLGSRRALDGSVVDGVVLGNLAATTTIGRLEAGIGVANVFNARYADPGAEEHVQSAIPQDGRTLRIHLTTKF